MGADKKIVDQWLTKADDDFGFASSALTDEETSYFDLICFHYQQAAEKYLKAYIVAMNLLFEKVHNLNRLQKICLEENKKFEEIYEECIFLNVYYIEPRYPLEVPMNSTRGDAEKAKVAAEKIGNFVKDLFKE